MAEPSRMLLTTIRIIDTFTDFTGSIIAWLSMPLVAAVAYEVFARYLFNAPTIWSFDVTYMLYASLFMLGAAYALHKGAHIRTDFFWDSFTPRTRGLIDAISYVVFFFPSFIILGLLSWHEASYAFRIHETSDQSAWRPVLWPLKAVIPIACVLLLIQGMLNCSRACTWRAPALSSSIKRKSKYDPRRVHRARHAPSAAGSDFHRCANYLSHCCSSPFSFGYLGMGATVFDLAYFQTIGMMKEELLAAVPLFIFMGFITEQAGLMERLFTAFRLISLPCGARFISSSS